MHHCLTTHTLAHKALHTSIIQNYSTQKSETMCLHCKISAQQYFAKTLQVFYKIKCKIFYLHLPSKRHTWPQLPCHTIKSKCSLNVWKRLLTINPNVCLNWSPPINKVPIERTKMWFWLSKVDTSVYTSGSGVERVPNCNHPVTQTVNKVCLVVQLDTTLCVVSAYKHTQMIYSAQFSYLTDTKRLSRLLSSDCI